MPYIKINVKLKKQQQQQPQCYQLLTRSPMTQASEKNNFCVSSRDQFMVENLENVMAYPSRCPHPIKRDYRVPPGPKTLRQASFPTSPEWSWRPSLARLVHSCPQTDPCQQYSSQLIQWKLILILGPLTREIRVMPVITQKAFSDSVYWGYYLFVTHFSKCNDFDLKKELLLNKCHTWEHALSWLNTLILVTH